jgi:hypothetical protein
VNTAAKTVIVVLQRCFWYTAITTSGHTAVAAAISGTVTRNLASTIVLTSGTKINGMLWYCNYDNGLPLAEAQLMLQ